MAASLRCLRYLFSAKHLRKWGCRQPGRLHIESGLFEINPGLCQERSCTLELFLVQRPAGIAEVGDRANFHVLSFFKHQPGLLSHALHFDREGVYHKYYSW